MRIGKIGLVLIAFLLGMRLTALAEEYTTENEIIYEYARLYGGEIQKGVTGLEDVNTDELVPGFDAEKIIASLAKGENIFSVEGILNKGISVLTREVRGVLKILVFILALSVLSTFLTGLQTDFTGKGASNAAFFACYAVIVGIAAAAFMETVRCGQTAIGNIAMFMRVLIPVVLISLIGGGATITATSFEMTLMGIIGITEWVIEMFFIPLILMSAALSVANNLSDKINSEKLVQLINKLIKWGITILMTVFVWIVGLQGIAAGSADGLTLKITKFATSNLIPMVGGILSESVETVMNCSVVIKNSVGVAGIIVVVLITVVPVMRVAACLIMFRMCAAVIQPIADKKTVKCISEMADSVSCVFALLVAVAVMFIIVLTIIINIGNTATLFGR